MIFLLALTLLAGASTAPASDPLPKTLPRSSPEAQGISSSAVLAFLTTSWPG
jgi:hypothetical protein